MRLFSLWVLLFVALTLTPAATAQGLNPATEPTALLRFVHGLPGAAAVDIYLDGERVVAALPPGEATAYGLTRPGPKTLALRAAGSDRASAPLLQQAIRLNTGTAYTFAAAGNGATVEGFLLADDIGAAGDGRGSLRLVNLVPGSTLSAAANEAALTGQVPYGQASERTFVSGASAAVTVVDSVSRSLLVTPAIPLANGALYSLFVTRAGEQASALVVSYPTTTGGPPSAPTWGTASADLAALNAALARATGAGVLPQTGILPGEATIPALLIVDGGLMVALAWVVHLWRKQRA